MIYAGRFDASALHIAHALKQTEIQKSYNKGLEKPIGEYLVSNSLIVKVKEEVTHKIIFAITVLGPNKQLAHKKLLLAEIFG